MKPIRPRVTYCQTKLSGLTPEPAIVRRFPNKPRMRRVLVSSGFATNLGGVFRVAASFNIADINRDAMSCPVAGSLDFKLKSRVLTASLSVLLMIMRRAAT